MTAVNAQAVYDAMVLAKLAEGWKHCAVCLAGEGDPCRYTTDRVGVVKGAVRPTPHFYREYKP